MKARLIDGPAWRGVYRGRLKTRKPPLRAGDVVGDPDASRLLLQYPRDFEPVYETTDERRRYLDRQMRAR